jgi:hypothetical protein
VFGFGNDSEDFHDVEKKADGTLRDKSWKERRKFGHNRGGGTGAPMCVILFTSKNFSLEETFQPRIRGWRG